MDQLLLDICCLVTSCHNRSDVRRSHYILFKELALWLDASSAYFSIVLRWLANGAVTCCVC